MTRIVHEASMVFVTGTEFKPQPLQLGGSIFRISVPSRE